MVKDCHANDSILVRSAGSDYKWDDDAFKDIFDQPKLKLQQLFNHENLQDAEITIEENTNRSKAAEIASKQHSLSKGQMLHDDLFNESYGTLTKKRLSNIMDTIPDTYSKDSLGFTWPNTKSSSGAAVSIGVFNSYPDDIDFVEGSVSELSSDFQNNGDSLNDVQKADFGHQNQSISEMSERIPRIESRLMNWAHSELETVEEIENTNVDGLKM